MDDLQHLESWMALQYLRLFSPSDIALLLQTLHSADAILAYEHGDLSLSLGQQQELKEWQDGTHPAKTQIINEIKQCQDFGIELIGFSDNNYPQALKDIHRPPYVLYVKGDKRLLQQEQLAVVGARKASRSACKIAYDWSQEIAAHNIIITSGLALGIDGAAHQGALDGGGKTIAVMAHGLDHIYPRQHQALAQSIIEQGVIVSEFPLFQAPKRDHFPRRNRIISGLAMGVLVVEAAIKSGSLITAQYALEQNRYVFAVPGSIHNTLAKGCHQLIKDGAYLVDSPSDILEAMQWQTIYQQQLFSSPSSASHLSALSASQSKVLEILAYDFQHIDEILIQTGMNVGDLSGELLLLEADGLIESQGASYRRIS